MHLGVPLHALSLSAVLAKGMGVTVGSGAGKGWNFGLTPHAGVGRLFLSLPSQALQDKLRDEDTFLLWARQPTRDDASAIVLASPEVAAIARNFVVFEASRVGGGPRTTLSWHETAMSGAWEKLFRAVKAEIDDAWAASCLLAGLTLESTPNPSTANSTLATSHAALAAQRLLGEGHLAGSTSRGPAAPRR